MMKKITFLLLVSLWAMPASAQSNTPSSSMLQSDLSPSAAPMLKAPPPLTPPAPSTYESVLKAAIRFGAFDLNDDSFIDNFAQVFHCDIYKQYHANEFDWRRVRAALRKSIQQEMSTYPTVIYLERDEYFTTYDFSAGVLNLAPTSIMRRTSNLELARITAAGDCGNLSSAVPELFTGILDNPIQIDGVELTEEQARDVVAGLKMSRNDWQKSMGQQEEIMRSAYGRYLVQLTNLGKSPSPGTITFGAHLINITFYEDPEYQIPFWRGGSTIKSSVQRENGNLQAIPFKGIDETGGKQ